MAQPVDMEEFLKDHFREQRERMEISDEDWDEYQERMLQQKLKRKRVHGNGQTTGSGLEVRHSESDNAARERDGGKKRRLSRCSGSLFADPVRSPSPPNNEVSTVNEGCFFSDTGVSSNLSNAVVAGSSTQSRRFIPASPTNIIPNASTSSSDFTSPEGTPFKSSAATCEHPIMEGPSGSSNIARSNSNIRDNRASKSLRTPADRSAVRKAAAKEKHHAHAERIAMKTVQEAKREAEKLKAAREEKEARMTPFEYAAILGEKWKSRLANTPSEKLFLTEKVILLICEEQNKAQKDTRIKLDIIARHGGKVAVRYDPSVVTHIIPASTSITLRKTLRVLGLKSLSEIPPNVKTVKWDWIVSGLTKRTQDSEVMHELFKQRMAYMYPARSTSDNTRAKIKGKDQTFSLTAENSVIEDFTSVYDSPNEDGFLVPERPGAEGSRIPQSASTSSKAFKDEPEDPLLPFYAKAREEAEAEDLDEESNLPQQELQGSRKTQKYKGFLCDKKGVNIDGSFPNWDVIEKLAELRELHRENGTQDDTWRVISYQKAIGSLKSHPTRIKSHEEATKLAGVSDKTADKIMEIIKTGELRRIVYTRTDDVNVMGIFSGIYGVGSNTARKWYNEGFRTLADLRQAVQNGTHKLSTAQEIGLNFYDDINDRMSRAEAQEIFDKIKPIALNLDPKLSMEIMGSFRRGKETCGDIDILLTRPTGDGITHAGILPRLCHVLRKKGILTEDLATPDEWGALEATYRGLCRRDATSKRRRIDILCIPYECRGAARIYYTGDDIFNRSIRLKANKMNMSLNQRGLFEGVVRDPQDRRKKLCIGSLLCSHSERKIFEILGVPWQEPHERVRSG